MEARASDGVLRRSLFAVLETLLRAIVPLAILPFVDIAEAFEQTCAPVAVGWFAIEQMDRLWLLQAVTHGSFLWKVERVVAPSPEKSVERNSEAAATGGRSIAFHSASPLGGGAVVQAKQTSAAR